MFGIYCGAWNDLDKNFVIILHDPVPYLQLPSSIIIVSLVVESNKWANLFLGCVSGWCHGVNAPLYFSPRPWSLYLITFIYKFQSEISTVAGYRLSELFKFWSFSGQAILNLSMQKWNVFPFMNGLLLLFSNIGQINLSYQFFQWWNSQLSHMVCIYSILQSYSFDIFFSFFTFILLLLRLLI